MKLLGILSDRKVLPGLFLLFPLLVFGQNPTANFGQNKTLGCLPLIVDFTDSSSGSIVSYYWELGNGNTSVLKSPSVLYSKAGVYTVKLFVTDVLGKKDSMVKNMAVTTFANPVAGFKASPLSGCGGMNVIFTDDSKMASNPLVSWEWNFGDGQTSQLRNPAHIYTTEGTYPVSLIVTDNKGCKNILNQTNLVNVSKLPDVSFTAPNQSGCLLPHTVNFTNGTPAQPGKTYTYLWDFGDGSTSTGKNPSHNYVSNGKFKVTLTVTDNLSCSKTLAIDDFISVGKLAADFNATKKSGCAPLLVNFTNNSQNVPPDAKQVWFFGDGDSAIGNKPAHMYALPGRYTVTLKITSPSGCTDSKTVANFIDVVPPPALDFIADSVHCDNKPFNFLGKATGVQQWEWDFGDNTSSQQQNPVKIYPQPGIYTVSVTATFTNGCIVTQTKKDYIKNRTQVAKFKPADSMGCAPLDVLFVNKSSSAVGIKTHEWDFGDGQTSTAINPKITYTKPGTYSVRLTITDSAGCKATTRFDSIHVGAKVPPDFFADPRKGCKQDMTNVKFTNTTNISTHKVDFFVWNIDGTEIKIFDTMPVTYSFKNHEFQTSPDSVSIQLSAFSNGCKTTIIKPDYIILYPPDIKVHYTIDPCEPDTVTFTNASMGADKFEWWFASELPLPTTYQKIADTVSFKRFLAPGKHFIKANGTNLANKCKDTQTYTIEILPILQAMMGISKRVICPNDSVKFQSYNSSMGVWEWRINGVPVSDKQNFTYAFQSIGTYDVTLLVIDMNGCRDSITIAKAVTVQAPSVIPVVTPDKGCFPVEAKLIVKGPSAANLKYAQWVIGDDTVTTTSDTIPFTFNKIYSGMNKAGVKIHLTGEDSSGCRATAQTRILISEIKPYVATTIVNNCNNSEFSFYNDFAPQPVGSLSFKWLVDDSVIYTSAAAKHTVTESGPHKIKLVVTDNGLGCSDSAMATVNIKVKKINAGFVADKTHIACPPLTTTFTDASTVENTFITKVQWWFGDGSSSIIASPLKNYFFPGNYNISYKISDARGCSDSITLPGKIFVGGPSGDYFLDRYDGCVPFEVNFSVKNKQAKSVRWDFGDGVLMAGEIVKNKYTRPGVYNPAMILEDTAGCTVVYPTEKPVIGYAAPQPDFTFEGQCIYDEFRYINQTDTMGQATVYVWKFDNNDTVIGQSSYYKYSKPGIHTTELKATSINGCSASITKTTEIKELEAAYSTNRDTFCFEDVVQVFDKSIAGAGIKQWQWQTGDGQNLFMQNPSFVYTMPGVYQLALIITDNKGCHDTLQGPGTLVVFDTLPPPAPFAYRVTVDDDQTLRFEYSPYQRNDFGKYIIYRNVAGQPLQVYKEITQRGDTIYIDKNVTPDDFAYTYKVVNQSYCGKTSEWGSSIAHTSILLKGQADTNRIYLNWSRYRGWNNVKTYHIYRKEPSQQAFAKIGAVPGTDTTYTDTSAYCNFIYEYYVMAEQVAMQPLFSRSNAVTVMPFHKPTVLPGSIIRVTVEDNKNILVEYAPPAIQTMPIVLYTIEKSASGVNYTTLHTSPKCCDAYLDEKVNVQARSYYYHVKTTDYCGDVSEPGNLGKSILLKTTMSSEDHVKVDWSAYRHWYDGVKLYELELMDAHGNFAKAATNNFPDTSYTDESGNYNQMEQVCYRVKAVSNTGIISYSNIDCEKGRSSIFVPNAFTPNPDAFNGTFVIVGSFIKTYELNIYSRWGEKIYTSYSLNDSWNGMFKGQPVQDDAYLYVIQALGMDGKHHNLSGTVTVLR